MQVATHLCLYNTLHLSCFGGLGLNSLHLSYILSKRVFIQFFGSTPNLNHAWQSGESDRDREFFFQSLWSANFKGEKKGKGNLKWSLG